MADAQLVAMAQAMGVKPPPGGSWMDQFQFVCDQLQQAVVICDVTVPGMKVQYTNPAGERLVGYSKAEHVGKNCRFMQGKRTEAAAVRQMVKGIRDATPVTVKVTNYKKDGTQFVNVLTLHPVKDSAGVYRYQIGVQSDGARAAQEGAALDQLRSVLPTMFDAKAQPKKFDESLTAVDDAAQRKQWQASMVKFTRLVWSMDWETSLRQLLSQQLAQEAFGAWVQQNSQADMAHLQLLVGALMIDRMDPEQGAQAAAQMCQQVLGKNPSTAEEALQLVRQQGASAQQLLASDVFPKFVQSKACLPLVEKLLGENAKNMEKADDLIWDKYTVPTDCAGWIHSFVMVAETYPACIVISDMQVPGNPMFFVNQEFCKITGYAKREVQGRNCRFLQGPQTEAQSVAVIQDTLRRGVDCHVKLTNYRKNGDLFENLLTMRPVHDSNGVMRFCIGVQFEVNRDTSLKSRLMKLDKLLKLLPSTLEVSSKAVGETHIKEENNEEKAAALETKLESALEGKTVGAPPPDAYVIPDDSSGSYADNREDLLEGIGVSLAPQAHRDHVTKAVPLWAPLHKLVGETKEGPGKPTPMNTASHDPYAVRIEAARKLLLNHEAVLRDTCNPSADKNINGNPLTQRELRRVPVELCPFVDQVLREAIRLLILPDGQPGVEQLAEKLDPSQPAQLAAWAMGARFIVRRIQGSDMEMPGRPADMSTSAATAMRAALQDVGGWMPLMMLASAGGGQPEGAAAAHSNEARQEAAQRLIANHANVLRDIANPSADKNIIGIPLTQLHLKRVPAEHAHFADQALREVVRRLLGGRPGTEYMQEHLDPTTPAQAAAWAQTAKYLDGRIQDQPDQKPGRQPDMSAAAGAAVRAVLAEVGAIGEAGAWGPLYQLMNQPGGDNAMGAAAAHPKAAREEAARNLISNHINVVNDVANSSPDKNIIGIPLTQLELRRVPAEHARFVDQALREVARRLLGNRQGTEQLEQRLDPSTPLQANVWAQTVKYLEGRIHDKPEQKPGRTPDMSPAAGAAMKAVMAEVGMGARTLLWGYLQQMISSVAKNEADGVAAFHSAQARQEAASKLIANHENVLNDVANASPTKNIIGVPLTQLDLRRVSAADACYADQAMRETVRRLIGKIPETEFLEEKLEHTMPAQMAAWARTTKYLCGRIQDRPEQKSGRAPDMSAAAGAAAKAVLAEVGGWASLKALLKADGSAPAIGAASGHSLEAREEAARKLIHNHGNVLKDVANPSPDKNIIGIPLTQLELQRVPPQHAVYADQLLREICRRLLGMRAGSELIEERLDAMNPEQAAVWAHAVRYLGGRIQDSPAMKPGRTPDMSAGAGAAMKAVLKELFELASMSPWQRLQKLHGMPALPNSVPVGAAAYFAPEARIEAATKLISNHENVLKDVANPSPDKNIIGIPLTQTELKRVPAQHAHYADQALREAVRRLLGPRVGSQQLEEHFNPFNPEQAVAWAQTAKYLEGRIHDKLEQKPGREPDMSTAAGAAMKAVLRDFGSWAPFYVLLDHTSGEQGVDGAAAGHSAAAREEAARKLIGNHTNVLRDVANPSADRNIIGIPLTQLDLDRVPWEDAGYADQLMREVTRRLLGRRSGSDQVEEKIDSSSPRQRMMWAQAAKYLDGRIQGSHGEKAGREPDLSAEAAAAMRAVLAEVGKPPAPAGGGGMNFFSALSSSPGGMFGGGMFGGAALPAPTGVPSPFATGAPAPFAAAPAAPPAQPMFGAPTLASMPPPMPPSMPAALPMPSTPAPSGFTMAGGAPKSPMGAGSSWEGLHKLLSNGDNGLVDGLAAAHSVEAREEAASKLIGNHDNVLKDVANPSPTSNIIGIPLTQAELRRVPAAHARYADQAMREAVRRLLGRRPGSEQMQEHVDPAAPGQAVAWALTAKYLIGRIQDRPQQKPGRQPDMSAAAGAAMKDVLSEIGDLVRDQTWGQLRAMHVNGAAQMAQGAAGGHSPAAREEAARKLLFNHENVLMDVANPSKTKNIIGIPLTQTELRRVSAADAVYADQIMRETVRRLLGNHPGSEQFEETLDPSTPAQAVAWAQTAKYLEGRIHDRPEQKPGRAPDMSAQAGAAMKAVLAELGGAAAAQSWAQLSQLLQSGGGSEADGAAAAHSAAAREEAARKLIGNHENVLKDVANPSPDKNIIGIPLTQLELKRVSAADACYADQMMRELVRRLLGRRPGSESLEERLDPSLPAQAVAWAKACKYLEGRIHDRPEQKPDRSPDMSAAAGAATKAVLAELMLAAGSQRWYYLQLLNDSARGAEADGAAGAHSAAAREEAAQKLLTNHVNVMKDVANASPSTNIDGIALTQLELRRVPSSDICYVDQALREIVRRLLGNRPGTEDLREHLEPWAPAQAQTWAHTAKYLEGRIHDRAQQKAGRQPDMSTAAGAAMKAVLAEMAAHARQHSWGQLLTLEASSGGTEAEGAAAGHSFEARSEAAVRLINNHENVLKDVANASPDRNIVGVPLTQLELSRVPPQDAVYADQLMREVVRRLLGKRAGSHLLEERLDPAVPEQMAAWAQAAKYLVGRIHDRPDQKPGRAPDMSSAAGAAIKDVLSEVGCWTPLHLLLQAGGGAEATGAAASHSYEARTEAAYRLIANHVNVLKDVANPSPDKNIIGIPLTQTELRRVDASDACFADQAMREVVRRLLGRRRGIEQLEERLNPSIKGQAAAWAQTAKYLEGRIQDKPEQKPGRQPDMSAAAGAAVKAVLAEIGALSHMSVRAVASTNEASGGSNEWTPLQQMMQSGAVNEGVGCASAFSPHARKEAAHKLISNHTRVLRDLTNPSTSQNIEGLPLTQLELKRVSPEDSRYVDQMLREVARRLLGGPAQLEERLSATVPAQLAAWAKASRYLVGRIQSTPQQRPGREPDMSAEAGEAMKAVVLDAGGWSPLQALLDSGTSAEADGAAAAHAAAAREEAARKLIKNHFNVIKDVANPSPDKNIIGIPLTQLELKRVPAEHAHYADQALREAVRRLLGRRPGADQLKEKLDPETATQGAAWALTAKYLNGRIQDQPDQKPGREPDMSAAAGAAVKAVLNEISGLAASAGGGYVNSPPDPQLCVMAQTMGVRPPSGGAWMDQFQFVCDQLQQAVMICDVTVPGMQVQYTNPAGERLVGYSKAEHVGKNCRFMQGKRTEAAAVRQMVKGIRDATPVTVKVTNYKKDGTQFVNVLTLHPVKDSAGVYRYQIGVQSDGACASQEGPALDKLRSVLPTMFDAAAQPKKFTETLAAVDDAAQRKQWRASMAKFTRLVWSMDWETSLRRLLTQPIGQMAFQQWLQNNAAQDVPALELYMEASALDAMETNDAEEEAIHLCDTLMGQRHGDGANALSSLRAQAAQMIQALAADSFPKFVQSKQCLPLVEQLLKNERRMKTVDELIWDKYTVPADCAGWIHSFVMVAETYPACIVISDMQVPGNPMFFVNQEFCKITGYAKREVQGRNCRFLQGPQTEAQSVAVIQDTLRRGVDCHVKLTNYRKNGDLFENLLTMRPVHDSNGVMRFCIGVQFEVNRDTSLKSRLMKLDKLLKLLPSTLEVSSRAVGEVHSKEENNEEKSAALESKLDQALAGATVGAPKNTEYHIPADTNDYFGANREDLLRSLGVDPNSKIENYKGDPNAGAFAVGSGANAAFASKQFDMTGLPPVSPSKIPA